MRPFYPANRKSVARIMADRTKPMLATAPVETAKPFVEVPLDPAMVGPRGGQHEHGGTLAPELVRTEIDDDARRK